MCALSDMGVRYGYVDDEGLGRRQFVRDVQRHE